MRPDLREILPAAVVGLVLAAGAAALAGVAHRRQLDAVERQVDEMRAALAAQRDQVRAADTLRLRLVVLARGWERQAKDLEPRASALQTRCAVQVLSLVEAP